MREKINADVNKNVRSLREENFVSKQRLFFTFARKKKFTKNKLLSLSLCVFRMIARSGSRACFTTTIVAKKEKNILLGKGGAGSFSYRRRFLSSPFKAFKEEEDMSSSQQQQQEEEHKVTPEFPKGEEYPSGREEDATTTTQSSFAAWEFAQGPFHGKKGFLVTSLAPGSVRSLLLFCIY